jgi:hypothetical protein
VDHLALLNDLLRKLLTKPNSERCARIFYDAAKVIYCRQKDLNKTQLKMKEIASALALVETFHSNAFRFDATGPLAENFGDCPQEKALEYYEKKVMGEEVDCYDRRIRLVSFDGLQDGGQD